LKALNDLILNVLLGALVRTEFAGLSQFTETNKEIVKRFSWLLNPSSEGSSLYCLIDLALNVPLNSRDYFVGATPLLDSEATVVNDEQSLPQEAEA